MKRKREFRELQEGNLVQLRSGGPKMKVLELNDDKALAQWKVGKDVHEQEFNVAALEVVSFDLSGD